MASPPQRRPFRPAAPGRVRIIAGRLRGSKLDVPDVIGLRPTADRVRETLFNWLMPVLPGARCLDLYAGTGALGIEAASRGAREVVLVERDRQATAALRGNLARLGVAAATVVEADALAFLSGPARPFDVVFLDPPFAARAWSAAAAALVRGWLAPQARVYVESPFDPVPAVPPDWDLQRELRAGVVRAALYRCGPAP
ncbi:MAG: 16S rRNA (guanine(966)-N(2))-methyltransferase RsmD [Pseudomonadota bacterium]